VFLNHDTYERHYWTVRLLGPTIAGESVLDLGGERGLARFAKGLEVRDANIVGPDAVNDPGRAFGDKSFDYAVSIDTLEHMPKEARGEHLRQLMRVARKRVVFCAPIGQPLQNDFQRRLLEAGTMDDASLQYVREHLDYGLPTPEEIESLLPGVAVDWYFSGNVKRYMVPGKPPESRAAQKAIMAVALFINWLYNATWLYFKVGRKRRAVTNRFYGVIRDLRAED